MRLVLKVSLRPLIRFTFVTETARSMAQLLLPASITYALSITLVKVSILLLYRRIFSTPNFRRNSLIIGAVSVAWCIATILGQIFLCRPISASWHPDLIFTDRCNDVQAFWIAITSLNVLIDVAILCLPIHMVSKLQLPTRKKIVVSGIFMLGGLYVHYSMTHLLPFHRD